MKQNISYSQIQQIINNHLIVFDGCLWQTDQNVLDEPTTITITKPANMETVKKFNEELKQVLFNEASLSNQNIANFSGAETKHL